MPGDLEAQIAACIDQYNHRRTHESLDNLTPAESTSAEVRPSCSNAHASNDRPSLKDTCFTKRSLPKINLPDEVKFPLNYALNSPNRFDDGHLKQWPDGFFEPTEVSIMRNVTDGSWLHMNCAVVAAVLFGSTGMTLAASPAARGHSLAVDACSPCHQVTSSQKRPQPVFDPDQAIAIAAPSFAEIARKYRGRPTALRRIILDPKHPMPEQDWDKRDLRAIISYIEGLPSVSDHGVR